MIRRTVAVLIALGAMLAWSSTASAVLVVPVANCTATTKDAGAWEEFGASGFTVEDRCELGEGLRISTYGANFGEEMGWRFSVSNEINVESFSFDIDGGDTSTGIEFGVGDCSAGCVTDLTFGPRSDASPTDHIVSDHPTNGVAWIYAKCTDPGGCAATSSTLAISNLEVNVTDVGPPTIDGSIDGKDVNEGEFLGWTNKLSLLVNLNLLDGGLGVYNAQLDIGGFGNSVATWDFSAQCASSIPLAWPYACSAPYHNAGIAQLGSLQDGVHDVSFTATDVGGNSATTGTSTIGTDRVAPGAPASSSIDFTETGWPGQRWTADPAVVMHWASSDELPDPSDDESPIDSEQLLIHRSGSATVLKKTFGAGVDQEPHTLATDGRWELSASYIDAATNQGGPATETIGLDRDAPNPPQALDVGDWLNAESAADGRRVTWEAPDPSTDVESGICGYIVRFDTSPIAELHFGDDDATIARSFPVPVGLPEGSNYFHVSAVSCAGIVSAPTTSELIVDTKAPALALTGLLEAGVWSSHAQTAAITATDAITGVDAVGFSLDNGPITWTQDSSATLVVPDGYHQLTASARDEAGNQSSTQVLVRTDTHAPSVLLPPPPADDPSLVTATVNDAASGLASAALELRRVDQGADAVEQQWKALGGAEPITRGTTSPVTLQRRIDDSLFAAGTYELRIAATDLAGNANTDGDFTLRSLQLPLRRQAELSAAVAEVHKVCRTAAGKACASVSKCAKKLRCKTVSVVDRDHAKGAVVGDWEDHYWLVGDAIDASGKPIAGAQVVVTSLVEGGDVAPVGTATTDSLGSYALEVPAGPTRELTARIAGSNSQQPASASAKITVRADVRFAPKPRKVRSGKTIDLAGRVLHPEWLPVGGVSVSIQWLSPNGWTAFVNPVSTDARGKFSHTYKWAKRKQKYSVKLRALVQPVAGWPFASGSSDAVKIRVQPAN